MELRRITKELRKIGVGIYYEDSELNTLQTNESFDDALEHKLKR